MPTKQKLIYQLISMADNMKSVAKDLEKVREDKADELRGAAYIAGEWIKSLKEEIEEKDKIK